MKAIPAASARQVTVIPLGGTRELRVSRARGLVVLAIHDVSTFRGCISGPLAIHEGDLDTVRSVLADVAGETGQTEATE